MLDIYIGRDYLKVGFYTEVLFPDTDVRFIAISDSVDSDQGENDLTPFRNIMNEWYARDVSKKVKTVMRAKGMAGEPLCAIPDYGYLKNPEDKNHWIIDEEAAEVIRLICHYCLDGLGPGHIAAKLREKRIDTPTTHFLKLGIKTRHKPPADPYDWSASTVITILSRREYLGHTVNFKTYRKSYKNKKTVFNAPEQQVVFENTHEAIIDQETTA